MKPCKIKGKKNAQIREYKCTLVGVRKTNLVDWPELGGGYPI